MQQTDARGRDLADLEMQAVQATQAGRESDAATLWGRILAIEPRHERSLNALGQLAFRSGDMEAARVAFRRLVEANGTDPQHWVNLGLACRNLQDEKGEEEAIGGALAVDPGDLLALIMRGNLYERQGKRHQAARAYGAAASVAPALERLHPELKGPVTYAATYKVEYDQDFAAFLDERLEPHFGDLAGEDLKRFRDSVDIMVGRKMRYDSRSARYHYPQLAPIEFFERAQFPWLDLVEAATGQVRDEFMALLQAEEGFAPYITYPSGVPLNQWAELNNSPRWSAFHLFERGERVEGNAAKCPRTMELLASVPQPRMKGRTPSAMFSLLKPRTRIPPHAGVTNVRLVTHLPLIVPDGCGFRVGNDTRQWNAGQAWVFDDTIEHEAWNDSDKLRVVLIFDVWHPGLTPPERTMITAMSEAMEAFAGGQGGFDP